MDQPNERTLIAIVITVAVIVILIALVVVLFVMIIVSMCLRNHKEDTTLLSLRVDDIRELDDNMTQANEESETKFSNSVHKTTSVNSEQVKESMSASSIPVPESDGIYSTPDDVVIDSISFTESKSPYRDVGQQQAKQNTLYCQSNNSTLYNIQCQNNSAYQETKFKYKCEDKDIKCLENSAYGNIKHGVDCTSECLDSHECTKQREYKADNSQHPQVVSEGSDYEECV